MTAALSVVPYYLAIDCDHDITSDTIQVSLDSETWTNAVWAAPSSDLIAEAAASSPVEAGFTRYWVRIATGSSNAGALPLVQGLNEVHAWLTDNPYAPRWLWRVIMPRE